jgi:hypothetical protein
MGLNWNEIKSRALLFSKTWADACNEDSQAKPFWIDFFEIFGITNKRVATFELHVKKLGGAQGFADLFWPDFAGKPLSDKHRKATERAAQCVLDARAQFADASLADLYDPLTMPPALLKAHQKLDTAVDAAYQPSGGKKTYASDAERVAFLFDLYQRITSLLLAPAGKNTKNKIDRKLTDTHLAGSADKKTLDQKIHPVRHHLYLGSYCATH